MFGKMGTTELLLILGIVLLIFGPKHLPKLGKAFDTTIKSFTEGMGEESDKGPTKIE
jgi:sec-independent protein translocase protein TatA